MKYSIKLLFGKIRSVFDDLKLLFTSPVDESEFAGGGEKICIG